LSWPKTRSSTSLQRRGEWIIETGFPFRIWTQGNALVWLNMMMAKNHLWTQGVPELEQELDALFNIHFAAGDYQDPCYRAFVLIGKEQVQHRILADLNGLQGEPLSPGDREGVYSLCRMITGSVSALETERRVQHSINLLEGLEHRVAAGLEHNHQTLLDREIRLAEATSRVQHLQNLLEEQQRQRADAETRLAEAASQAAHYRNLLDEEQRQRADAATRLQGAHSELAQEQSARKTAEEDLRSIRAKLSRFPFRLFVR
jgi:DNA repair exonuclease SbcCD ATPase subunit